MTSRLAFTPWFEWRTSLWSDSPIEWASVEALLEHFWGQFAAFKWTISVFANIIASPLLYALISEP